MGKTVAASEKRDEIAASLEVSPPLRAQADEVIEREGTFLSRFSGRSGGMVARGWGGGNSWPAAVDMAENGPLRSKLFFTFFDSDSITLTRAHVCWRGNPF